MNVEFAGAYLSHGASNDALSVFKQI